MTERTLSDLNIFELAEVISIENKDLELKLISMGCVPGEEVVIERKALFGDPVLIRTGGTLLSLRKADAAEIIVKSKPGK